MTPAADPEEVGSHVLNNNRKAV